MAARPLRPEDDFDPRIARLIRHHGRRLVGCHLFRPDEREDVTQDLGAHVVSRMPKHDPRRASAYTFAARGLASKQVDLARHAGAQKRDRRRERPLHDVAEDELAPLRERAWRVERVDVRLDVRDALEGLPHDARHVAGLLMVFNEAEVSRVTGMGRQKVRRLREVITRHLRERGLP
jgi:DNA-directed RNA polymerase specialized sigma24 family protein